MQVLSKETCRIVKSEITTVISNRDWHVIVWFHWLMWLADGCILIPSFSRETRCQKVMSCKQDRGGVAAWRPWCKQKKRLLDIMSMDQRYGKVPSVRSKSNALLAYVSNFLTVFFILGLRFVFCGKTGKWCFLSYS